MSDSRPIQSRKVSVITVVVAVLVTAVSTAVIAEHEFNDVPNSNQFHGSITWMADNEITVGCNEAGNQFCPDDNVRRETMSAFMRRLVQTFGVVSDQVTGTSDSFVVDGSGAIETGVFPAVEVTPKAEVNVVIEAHASLQKASSSEGRYHVEIRRDSCDGESLAEAFWRGAQNTEATFDGEVVSLTAHDVVSEPTTYELCFRHGAGTSPDLSVYARGLTATWTPTG